MGDLYCKDCHSLIFDTADQTVISDAVPPEISEGAFQGFTKIAGVF